MNANVRFQLTSDEVALRGAIRSALNGEAIIFL
jgi:hypothetical protein